MGMAEKISDYAVIGDCRSAALISREGSIDWLCWPGFDSPSVFARILDRFRGGAWSIFPSGRFESRRRYIGDTPVLRTEFSAAGVSFSLTDFMPAAGEKEKRRLFRPDHEIIRIMRCEQGEGEFVMSFVPRPQYGREISLRGDSRGVRCVLPSGLLTLTSEAPLAVLKSSAGTKMSLKAGESCRFSLTFNSLAPATIHPLGGWSEDSLSRTLRWWEAWASLSRYSGKYRSQVMRSAVTLKLLNFSPSGTFIAAPTTSLPEQTGGALNWDYRYCWLRDSSLTVRALTSLGYHEEAKAYVSWLLHSTRLTLPELGVLYDVYGRRPGREREIDFSGYADSSPVRTGNAAASQLQLDVYGELADAAFTMLKDESRLDKETRGMLLQLGEFVRRHWGDRESGIWEVRGEPRRHTHSLALCWVCLDRLSGLSARGLLPEIPAGHYARDMERIREQLEKRSWNFRLGSFVSTLDGEELDASLLLLPLYGFIDAGDARMRSTYERIREMLGAGPGLFYRNRHFSEGAFAVCSCWAADYLSRGGGSLEEADGIFGEFLGYANDVGLFGEEIDPVSGEALGNFPLAFTHLGVINTAVAFERGERREP